MLENLTIALQITLIGMGVVFAALIVLALIMAALVRLTADAAPAEAAPDQTERGVPADQLALRARIAAAAVAAARTQPRSIPPKETVPPTAAVSAWQAVMRGRQLKQRGPIR